MLYFIFHNMLTIVVSWVKHENVMITINQCFGFEHSVARLWHDNSYFFIFLCCIVPVLLVFFFFWLTTISSSSHNCYSRLTLWLFIVQCKIPILGILIKGGSLPTNKYIRKPETTICHAKAIFVNVTYH